MHAPQRSTFPYRESSARDKCLLDYHPLLLVEGLRVLPGEVLPESAHFTFKSQSTIICFYPVWGENRRIRGLCSHTWWVQRDDDFTLSGPTTCGGAGTHIPSHATVRALVLRPADG